jgi:hypothetical protein
VGSPPPVGRVGSAAQGVEERLVADDGAGDAGDPAVRELAGQGLQARVAERGIAAADEIQVAA